jgi:hypothetical protein
MLMLAAVWNGLFYDRHVYFYMLPLYGACFVCLFRKPAVRPAPLPFTVGLPWVVGAAYLLPLAAGPVSMEGTLAQLLRWTGYGAFLFLVVRCAALPGSRRWLHYGFLATGWLLVLQSFLALYGIVNDPYAVQLLQDERLSALGMRLSGLLQYANTFGAVMSAYCVYALCAAVGERRLLDRAAAALPLIPFAAGVLLSESRGAWLALAIGWILGFLIVGRGRRLGYTAVSGIAAAAAGQIASRIADGYLQGNLSSGWPVDMAVWAIGFGLSCAAVIRPVSAGVGLWPERFHGASVDSAAADRTTAAAVAGQSRDGGMDGMGMLQTAGERTSRRKSWRETVQSRMKIHDGKKGFFAACCSRRAVCRITAVFLMSGAAAGWVLFLAAFPDAAADRLNGPLDTAASRRLFYQDALVMWRDSPWIGFGGDAWREQFAAYQREPYVGSEVHSGYLDMLLDTGLLGAGLFTAMLAAYGFAVWKRRRLAAPALAVLLAHSAVDFDMSYGLVWLMALWLIGPALLEREPRGGEIGGAAEREAAAAVHAGRDPSGMRPPASPRRPLALLPPLLLLAAALGIAGCFAYGEAALFRAGAAQEPQTRLALLRAAVAANPYAADSRLRLAAELPAAAARPVLERGLAYAPRHTGLLWQLALTSAELDDWDAAGEYAAAALRGDRFNKTRQTEWIRQLNLGAERALYLGNVAEALARSADAARAYESYRSLVEQVNRMDRPANGKKFAMTLDAKLAAAEAYYRLNQFERAVPLFQEVYEQGGKEQQLRSRSYLDRLGVFKSP